MPKRPDVPAALRQGPFTVAAAREAGIGPDHLRGASWIRLGPDTYVWRGIADTPLLRLHAARCRLPEQAVFSGYTAAWLDRFDVIPYPIEVTIPNALGIAARSGLVVRRSALLPAEVVLLQGFPATSTERTLADLAGRLSLVEAVVLIDIGLHLGRTRLSRIGEWVENHPGARGVARFRAALAYADAKAESPQETRLRMFLLLGGLPRPRVQPELRPADGSFIARADLYYAEARLAVEYDGGTHRESLVADNQRQNKMVAAGTKVLRFTAAELKDPERVVALVAAKLGVRLRNGRLSFTHESANQAQAWLHAPLFQTPGEHSAPHPAGGRPGQR